MPTRVLSSYFPARSRQPSSSSTHTQAGESITTQQQTGYAGGALSHQTSDQPGVESTKQHSNAAPGTMESRSTMLNCDSAWAGSLNSTADKAEGRTANRQFSSGVFAPTSKHTTRGGYLSSTASTAAACSRASPSRISPSLHSTPRTGGGFGLITAVPGRARAVQPTGVNHGSTGSTCKKPASQPPLTVNMAAGSHKSRPSSHSSSTSRATPGRDATESYPLHSSGINRKSFSGCTYLPSHMGTEYDTSPPAAAVAAAIGRNDNSSSKRSSWRSSRPACSGSAASEAASATTEAAMTPHTSNVSIMELSALDRLLSRHKQQHSVLGKEFDAAARLVQPGCAATGAHLAVQQANRSNNSSSQQGIDLCQDSAASGACPTGLAGVMPLAGGREYLQRLQQQRFAASTTNMDTAVFHDSSSSSTTMRIASGGGASDTAAQHSSAAIGKVAYAAVAAAAAASSGQPRVSSSDAASIESSPLTYCRPLHGSTAPGMLDGRTRVGTLPQQQPPQQQYSPAMYTAAGATACNSGLQQQQCMYKPAEYRAGPAKAASVSTGSHQQQKQQQLYRPHEHAAHADLRTTSSVSMPKQQQPVYNPEQYARGAALQQQQPQSQLLYRPDKFAAGTAAATAAASGSKGLQQQQQQIHPSSQCVAAGVETKRLAAAMPGMSSILQRNQQQLAGKLAERLEAACTVAPGVAVLPPAGVNSSSLLHDVNDDRQQQSVTRAPSGAAVSAAGPWHTAGASDASICTGAATSHNTTCDFERVSSHNDTETSEHEHNYSSGTQLLGHQHRGVQRQQASSVDQQPGAAVMLPTTTGHRRHAHSGSLSHTQLPQTHAGVAVVPARSPHPLYTAQPPQQQQQQQQQQTTCLFASSGAAVPAAPASAPCSSETGETARDNVPQNSSSGSSTSMSCAYASTYGSRSHSNSGSQALYHSAGSNSSWLAVASVIAANNLSPFAQGCSGTAAVSGAGLAAGTEAVQHRCSFSSAGSIAVNCSGAGSSSQLPSPQHWQQQQQQGSLSQRASAASSSTLLASRQPSFLIGTQPLSDDPDESGKWCDVHTPGASLFGQGIFTGCSVGDEADADAASKAAKQQFLSCNFDSQASSMTAAEGPALHHHHQQQQDLQQGLSISGGSCRAAAAAAGCDNRCSGGTAPGQLLQPDPTGTRMRYTAASVLESDTDISEVSSSISQCSSSSDSDSEDCAAAQPDWKRRLGRGNGLRSSVSISTEGRSSSCGSGRELEHDYSMGKQTTGSHLAVAASSSNSRGQLPNGCVGLENLGNTCFMNSILQCLNCLPELVAALLGPRLATKCIADAAAASAAAGGEVHWGHKATVGPALCSLIGDMWSSSAASVQRRSTRVVSPRHFLAAVSAADERWGDGCQQDSQEFLHSLLEQLQSECNRVSCKPQYKELSSHGTVQQQAIEAAQYARSWHDSLVDDLFGGQLQSTITCKSCKSQSHCFDPFLDLSVPIATQQQVSLQDCLQAFVEQEELTGSEQVKCNNCKQTCDATKRLQIYSYPRLLVLTLKRFNSGGSSRTGSGGWFGSGFSPYYKNQTPVKLNAQQVLDLQPYCSASGVAAARAKGASRPQYQLLAVSEHSGCLGGGHYTAQGRSVLDGSWYNFNDSCVTPESHPSRPSTSAYVLFFRLVGA